eukprot:Pgem_evm1s16049
MDIDEIEEALREKEEEFSENIKTKTEIITKLQRRKNTLEAEVIKEFKTLPTEL